MIWTQHVCVVLSRFPNPCTCLAALAWSGTVVRHWRAPDVLVATMTISLQNAVGLCDLCTEASRGLPLLQAQDRCHRIGQTRPVHIYRLVSVATIEENILAKSDQKRQVGSGPRRGCVHMLCAQTSVNTVSAAQVPSVDFL
jgi:hypothetical protein